MANVAEDPGPEGDEECGTNQRDEVEGVNIVEEGGTSDEDEEGEAPEGDEGDEDMDPEEGLQQRGDREGEEEEAEELLLHFECSAWTREVWMTCLRMSSRRGFPSDLVR